MNKLDNKKYFGIVVTIIALFIFLILIIILLLGISIDAEVSDNAYKTTFSKEVESIVDENEHITFNEESGILYVNNEIIVVAKVDTKIGDIKNLAIEQGANIDDTMEDIGVYRFIYSEPISYEKLSVKIEGLRQNALVDDAYYNVVSLYDSDVVDGVSFESRDPVYPNDSWGCDIWNSSVPRGNNWGMEAIDAPGAWGYLNELNTVNIGLIDTMPNTLHPDLKNMFENTSNIFIDKDTGLTSINSLNVAYGEHGNHVSGIMNADWNNTIGVSGVMGGKGKLYYSHAYYVKNGNIYDGYNDQYTYFRSLKTLIDQDVQVVNISQNTSRLIGFAASHGNNNAINYLTLQADFVDKSLSRLISKREADGKRDFVICVAAGNSNNTYYYKDDEETYGYRDKKTFFESIKSIFGWHGEIGNSLAKYNNFLNLMSSEDVKNRIIVVGSIGIDNKKSSFTNTVYKYSDFSNVGDRVDIVAPGENIYSCGIDGYYTSSGTSMSAPHVSGVAGLIFACDLNLSGPDVKNILLESTSDIFYYNGGHSGLVNAKMAVVNALVGMGKVVKNKNIEKVPIGFTNNSQKALDLCFVVDTTGSMEDDIDNAKENMSNILDTLAQKTSDYRVSLIDYRDYESRTGYAYDYPYKIQLSFTNDSEQIKNSIYNLDLGNGGDDKETVYSALIEASRLDWREDAKKVIIILGDAPPLDPEPETGYTYSDVSAALYASDIGLDYDKSDKRVTDFIDGSLINVYSIGTNASDEATDFFREISEDTGGSFLSVDNASEVSDAIIDSIEQINITDTVPVNIDFGNSIFAKNIDIYKEGVYMFTIKTDGNGKFQFDAIEPGNYYWCYKDLLTVVFGMIEITGNNSDILAKPIVQYKFSTFDFDVDLD